MREGQRGCKMARVRHKRVQYGKRVDMREKGWTNEDRHEGKKMEGKRVWMS